MAGGGGWICPKQASHLRQCGLHPGTWHCTAKPAVPGTQGPFFLEEQTDKEPLTWWQGVLWDGSPSAAPPASSFLSSLKAWRCLCFSLGLDCAFSSVSPAHQSSFTLNEDKHAKSLLGS